MEQRALFKRDYTTNIGRLHLFQLRICLEKLRFVSMQKIDLSDTASHSHVVSGRSFFSYRPNFSHSGVRSGISDILFSYREKNSTSFLFFCRWRYLTEDFFSIDRQQYFPAKVPGNFISATGSHGMQIHGCSLRKPDCAPTGFRWSRPCDRRSLRYFPAVFLFHLPWKGAPTAGNSR